MFEGFLSQLNGIDGKVCYSIRTLGLALDK